MAEFFESPRRYVQSATSIQEKICKIDTLITALEDAAIEAAAGADVSEYSLDDGQTKIRAVNRSVSEIANSITAFEQIRQMYILRYGSGRVIQLVDRESNRTGV